jgi:hypothetical protein
MKKEIQEIIDIKTKHEEELFKVDSVHHVDVGIKETESTNPDEVFIRVFMEDISNSHLIPKELEGVQILVTEGKMPVIFGAESTDTKVLAQDDSDTINTKAFYNPVQGGISVGPSRKINGLYNSGTLGALVRGRSSGLVYGLSNFHVLCADDGWKIGDQIMQPAKGNVGSTSVGNIVAAHFPGIVGDKGYNVDAAITSILDRDVSDKCLALGTLCGSSDPQLSSTVTKVGKTSGETTGVITGIKATMKVVSPLTGKKVTFGNQIVIQPAKGENAFLEKGDSGSVVVDYANFVVGLLFARRPDGGGYANEFSNVRKAFDVEVYSNFLVPGLGYLGSYQFGYNIGSYDNKLQHIEGIPSQAEQVTLINCKTTGHVSFRNNNGLYLNDNMNFTEEGPATKWIQSTLITGVFSLKNVQSNKILKTSGWSYGCQVGFEFPPSFATSDTISWTAI